MLSKNLKRSFLAAAALTMAPAIARASNISDVYADGAGTYTLTGTVTDILNVGATSDSFVLNDDTGSVLFYSIPTSIYIPDVGDDVTVTSTDSPYQGSPEMTSTGFTEELNSQNNSVTPPVLSIPQFNASGSTDGVAGSSSTGGTGYVPYAESMVELENVYMTTSPTGGAVTTMATATNTTYYLNDGNGNGAALYDYKSDSAIVAAATAANAQLASDPGFYSGPLNIVGYVDEYYGQAEIYPVSITAAPAPEPATLGLMSLGAIGLLQRRHRRSC